jgi:hypothetical protein
MIQIFTSWNRMSRWLHRIQALQKAVQADKSVVRGVSAIPQTGQV